jgi:hypothetical protein
MVARFRPASDVPVDAGRLQAPGERRGEQEMIDAKACVALEPVTPIRPERGYRLVRMRGPSASVQPCFSNAAYAARACGCTSASFSHDVVG